MNMRQELAQLGGGAHALAIQILGNADDAADAVHDALATALSKPDSYDAQKGPLKPWFMRVVRNRCLDMKRRQYSGVIPVEELADTAAGPEEALETAQRGLAVQEFLPDLAAVRHKGDLVARYHQRNQRVVEAAQAVFAFVAPDRKGGTEDTVRRAEAAGRPVLTFSADLTRQQLERRVRDFLEA